MAVAVDHLDTVVAAVVDAVSAAVGAVVAAAANPTERGN